MRLSWTTRIVILLAFLAGGVIFFSLEPNLEDPSLKTEKIRGVIHTVNSYPSNPDIWIELKEDAHKYIVKNGRSSDLNTPLLELVSLEVVLTTAIHFNLMDPSGNLRYVKEIQVLPDSTVVYSIP